MFRNLFKVSEKLFTKDSKHINRYTTTATTTTTTTTTRRNSNYNRVFGFSTYCLRSYSASSIRQKSTRHYKKYNKVPIIKMSVPSVYESGIMLDENESKICVLIKKYIDSYNADYASDIASGVKEPLVARISGGWVRDKVLGKQSHDLDIAINTMSGEEFVHNMLHYYADKSALPDCFNNKSPFFHNINTIKKNPEKSKHLETTTTKISGLDIDFVNLRNETYTDDSRIPLITNGTPQEDAIRRDATLNALFYNITTNSIEDYTGQGLQDLKDGVLRTPLDPLQTFMDDPLRILRLIRFSAIYNFTLHDSITKCFVENHAELMEALQKKISKERIGVEVMKILDHDLDTCKRGFKVCCDFNFLTAIFYHSFDPAVIALNENNENRDLEKINAVYNPSASGAVSVLNEMCNNYIINNSEFPWTTGTTTGVPSGSTGHNSSLAQDTLDKNLANKILVFSCLLSCLENINIYTNAKNKTIKNLKNSMAEWILKDTLRFGKQYYQPVALIVDNISALHTFIEENLIQSNPTLKRSDICAHIIPYESHLHTALYVQKILFGDAVYNAITAAVAHLNLEHEYLVKPLINGKELAKILNRKPGVWMSEFNKRMLAWQYENPHGTRDQLVTEFQSWEM